jgi:type IV pilus biogenesis protein CpaD/CtpE
MTRPTPLPACGRMLALALALTVGACVEYQPTSLLSRYDAVPSEVQHDLYFVPGSPELARGEVERLHGVLRSLVLRPEDDILVNLASTGSEVLDQRRVVTARRAVAPAPARVRIVARPGWTARDRFPDVALVQVLRYGRVAVHCQTQNGDFVDERFGRSELMMGCANALNIASQTVEPRDLTAPGTLSAAGSAADIRAVEAYREGNVAQATIDSLAD